MPRIAFRVIVLAGMAALTACGGGSSKEVADRYRPVQLDQAATMRVNGYLWQAALETLHFMPIVSTDATGGVIVTDWYTDPSAPNERVKMRVAVMDARLRADALKVSINRQAKDRSGEWAEQPVQQATVAGVEDAILVRARQIRIGTVTEKED
jgi:hypothetical protein